MSESEELKAQVTHLQMALADTEALEMGTSERCAKLQSQLDAIRAQEPVAIVKHVVGGPVVHLIGDVKPQTLLYTHAPDSASRIAELERERDAVLAEARAYATNLKGKHSIAGATYSAMGNEITSLKSERDAALETIGFPDSTVGGRLELTLAD